jgi:hypothetical protein
MRGTQPDALAIPPHPATAPSAATPTTAQQLHIGNRGGYEDKTDMDGNGLDGLRFEGAGLSAGEFAQLSEAMQRLPGSFRAAAQGQFLGPIEVWLQAYKEAQVRRFAVQCAAQCFCSEQVRRAVRAGVADHWMCVAHCNQVCCVQLTRFLCRVCKAFDCVVQFISDALPAQAGLHKLLPEEAVLHTAKLAKLLVLYSVFNRAVYPDTPHAAVLLLPLQARLSSLDKLRLQVDAVRRKMGKKGRAALASITNGNSNSANATSASSDNTTTTTTTATATTLATQQPVSDSVGENKHRGRGENKIPWCQFCLQHMYREVQCNSRDRGVSGTMSSFCLRGLCHLVGYTSDGQLWWSKL